MKLYRKVTHEKNTVKLTKNDIEEILTEKVAEYLNKDLKSLSNIDFEYCFEDSPKDYEDVILQEVLITSNDITEEFVDTPNNDSEKHDLNLSIRSLIVDFLLSNCEYNRDENLSENDVVLETSNFMADYVLKFPSWVRFEQVFINYISFGFWSAHINPKLNGAEGLTRLYIESNRSLKEIKKGLKEGKEKWK